MNRRERRKRSEKGNKTPLPVLVLGIIAFLLSGMPKVRVVVGAPLYFVDALILYLVLATSGSRPIKYRGLSKRLITLVGLYFFFMILSELHGILVYGQYFDSFYLLFRFAMACSLPFVIPKVVRSLRDLAVVLKGLCAGLSLSALLAIFYSLPFTRGIARAVFSIRTICPVSESELAQTADALRGQTLIGTSTFSSGVMAMLWPLLYMGSALYRRVARWKYLFMAALLALPVGIIATYGRSAWLSVVLVFGSMMLWGGGKGRMKTVFVAIVFALIVAQIGIDSKSLRVDIVVNKTERTINTPLEDENERARFMAYVDPFRHVAKYPIFFMVGTGAARRKCGGNAYEEGKFASHTVPAMAYYTCGVGGAICHILILVTIFRLCYHRLSHAGRMLPSMVWIWRALLASCFGMLPWWLFGHGAISQPRGAMVYFLFIGIILACDQIYVAEVVERRRNAEG